MWIRKHQYERILERLDRLESAESVNKYNSTLRFIGGVDVGCSQAIKMIADRLGIEFKSKPQEVLLEERKEVDPEQVFLNFCKGGG